MALQNLKTDAAGNTSVVDLDVFITGTITVQDTASTTTVATPVPGASVNRVSGVPTASSAVSLMNLSGEAGFSVDLDGTWTGTVVIERTTNGAVWTDVTASVIGTAYTGKAFTANGALNGHMHGCVGIRVRATAPITGTLNVVIRSGAVTGHSSIIGNVRLGDAANPAQGLKVNADGSANTALIAPLPTGTNALGSVTVSNFPTSQPVTGTFFQATQPVSGTFFQSTQPVSLATNTPDVIDRAGRLLGITTLGAGTAAVGSVSVTGSVAVTGAFFQATQPVSLAANTPDVTDRAARALGVVSLAAGASAVGSVIVTTLPALVAGAAIVGKFGIDQTTPGTTNAVSVATLPALSTGTNSIGTVQQASLTKGVQGATGVSTQDLKDAGRSDVVLSATSIASVTAETIIPINTYLGTTSTAGASTYGVAATKRFRMQAFRLAATFATPSTTATFATVTIRLRATGAAGASTASPLVLAIRLDAASNTPGQITEVAIPDGLEWASGASMCFTQQSPSTAGALVIDVVALGFEY